MTPRPFRIFHSSNARTQFAAAITAATLDGKRMEAISAARAIEKGLLWYADEFGESRQQLQLLGELRWAAILPLSIWFAVHVGSLEVQVSRYRYIPCH